MAGSKKKTSKRGGRRAAKATKDETVETRTAGAAQYKLPEESRLKHHLSNIEGWEKKLADLKLHVKKAYETAAGEGVSKSLLKKIIEIKAGDQLVARQFLESVGIGLKAIGASFQLNVFDAMWESDVEQAKAEARMHVANGKSMECRFAEGSEAHEAYVEEWMFRTAKAAPGADKLTDDEIRAGLAKEDRGTAADNVHQLHS